LHISGELQLEELSVGTFTINFTSPTSIRVNCEKWVTLFRLLRLTSSITPAQLSLVRQIFRGKTAAFAVRDTEKIKLQIDKELSIGPVVKQVFNAIIGLKKV